MSSGLYGGRGWDEPVIQVDMELDTLEPLNRRWTTVRSKLVNSQGEVAKPNERHLNWYTWRFTMNQRHFHTGLAMGMWRYVSCMLMINSPFVLSDGRHDARLGLHLEPWNDQMVIEGGEIYDRTQVPYLLQHQEETAEETLGSNPSRSNLT